MPFHPPTAIRLSGTRFSERTARHLRREEHQAQARYEAAYTDYGTRSWLYTGVVDSRIDANSATRLMLLNKHRHWAKNSPLVKRIKRIKVQFAVGPTGLLCIPNSEDEAWNEWRGIKFQQWAREPEIGTRFSFATIQKLWEASLVEDGEFFCVKRSDRRQCRIQNMETHRCYTPPHLGSEEGKGIVDGIELGPNMKPVAYWFLRDGVSVNSPDGQLSSKESWERIAAENVVHSFAPEAVGMMRGLPQGFAALNLVHDYDDLQKLEMKVAKKLASRADIVTNATGEADLAAMRRQRMQIQSQDSAGNSVVKERAVYYENKLGGDTIYAKNGETVQQAEATRPSQNMMNYWDMLVSDICAAYDTPKLLVVPYSLQGTVSRADLDVSSGGFRFDFEIVAEAAADIYQWQCDWAVQFDREMGPESARIFGAQILAHGNPEQKSALARSVWAMDSRTPERHRSVVIRPPRAPNVDIGYNATAKGLELEKGMVTFQDFFAERQQDWRHEFRQSAEAAFYLRKLAKEFSTREEGIEITVDDIAQKIKQQVVKTEDKPEDKSEEEGKSKKAEPVEA